MKIQRVGCLYSHVTHVLRHVGVSTRRLRAGLYTEMDFRNEAFNSQRMERLLSEAEFGRSEDIHIPQPVMEYTTRWVGVQLLCM